MTNAFEQFAALASANQTLLLKFAEISQAAIQRQAEIASRGLAPLPAQDAEEKPAAFSNFAGFSTVFQDAEQNRQASLAATQEAVAEWQTRVGQLLAGPDVQKQFAEALQAWSKPLAAETEGKASAPAPEKTAA
ncbi:hypothetical protein L6Q21_13710 [Sandaracinobacter sp. RS1-74]|nr:hypothetical protein [Sandaracinobacteroides sayramensis]